MQPDPNEKGNSPPPASGAPSGVPGFLVSKDDSGPFPSAADPAALDLELFHYNPLETLIVDREGRVVDFNLAKKASGGRLPAPGQRMYADYAADHEIDMRAELLRCMETNRARTFPALKYHEKYIRVTLSPFPRGAIIVSQNVTEQVLAEKALRRSEAALRRSEQEKALILSSVQELVTYQGTDRTIRWANPPAEKTFEAEPGGLAGRKCHAVWQGDGEPCPNCPLDEIVRTGQPAQAEKTTPDGRVWATRGYPVRDEAGALTGVVEVNLDITLQKKAEQDRAIIQAQLLQAQKMEAVGTLAGGVAHDFNNLLTAIQGCLDLAMLKVEAGSPLRQDLSEVQNAARRAADLTRQLLLFSRRHLTHLISLQLNRAIDDLLKMLHRLIGEDIEIVTQLDPGLHPVQADHGTLEQVIVNLSVNARDAMPEGGRLTLTTENVELDEFYCRLVPDARPGRFVRLSISDTGAGMTREVRERIFEPFFSTKGPGRGSGLGLSVVYGIVKQHNGWINVYSEPGQGSMFRVYLPAASGQAAETLPSAVETGLVDGAGERVLVVEDENMVRDFTRRALEKHGYRVRAAASVGEALAVFTEEGGDFDLVFTDVVLPDATGLSLLEALIPQKPSIKVLLTSGYTDTKSQWRQIQEKGLRFLQKPFTLVDLLQTVRKALAD